MRRTHLVRSRGGLPVLRQSLSRNRRPGTNHAYFGTLKSLTVIFALLGACSGCGMSGGANAALIPVKGKVTYKGQPLTQGRVTFESEDTGRRASGKLQSDGSFVLTTYKEGDGVVAGDYMVIITDVDKTLAKDRAFKKYMFRSYGKMTAKVTPENTEFPFDLN